MSDTFPLLLPAPCSGWGAVEGALSWFSRAKSRIWPRTGTPWALVVLWDDGITSHGFAAGNGLPLLAGALHTDRTGGFAALLLLPVLELLLSLPETWEMRERSKTPECLGWKIPNPRSRNVASCAVVLFGTIFP